MTGGKPPRGREQAMPVTRDDVIWCYRQMLGRTPESESVIASHTNTSDLKSLVSTFLQSDEFRESFALAVSGPKREQKGSEGFLVEWTATPDQLQQCVHKVRSTWRALGRTKPHFSVLTNEKFLPDRFADYSKEFWLSGEADAARIEDCVRRYSDLELSAATVLELGCGVGRVSFGLAKRFGHVIGYDISREHLDEGIAYARAQRIGNVEFKDLSEIFPGALPACDVFHSRIVLQHNPPPLIAALIRMGLDALRPGAIATFQVPVFKPGYRFVFREWLAAPPASDMEMHCLPQRAIFDLIHAAGCIPVEVREDDATGPNSHFVSNTFVVRRPNVA
jgi:SAM-dependent methyltransferase